MQFQSDIVDTVIERPKMVETTALGAAYLAGLTTGYWKNEEELINNQKTDRIFKPVMEKKEREEAMRFFTDQEPPERPRTPQREDKCA